jgi:gliding motility-associated-like protein
MKKIFRLFYLLVLLCCSYATYAMHVKGGHIEYIYNKPGASPGTSNYTFTITVFFSCTTQGPKDHVYLGIYDAGSNAFVLSQEVPVTTFRTVAKTDVNPCMSNPPTICYEIYTYVYAADIPNNKAGYILAVQDALRINGIINIANSENAGITLTASIPGVINGHDYHTNSSPVFAFKDTAIVCYKGPFSYQFAASDKDGDSLSYSFGNGLNVLNAGGNTSDNPPAAPPYTSLTYNPGYSGASPLGSGVTINHVTGLIAGTAPATTGEYVIAVYVKEWRQGVLLDSVKKELQIYVYNCSLIAASLNTSYLNCDNFTFTFENESASSSVSSYLWDFGVTTSTTDTSTQPTPTFTYPDSGLYQLKLKVSTTGGCTDSAVAPVKVYPGFTPAFTVTGSCYQSPFIFTDNTLTKYGTVSSWSWNFGDVTSIADVSALQNPTYAYPAPTTATVFLKVSSDKGCTDTVSSVITINGKPDIFLPFKDTLICSIDSLSLIVQSTDGDSFSWSPAYNIINPNSTNPVVYPKDTTVYSVIVKDKGCIDSASIKVNVLNFITVTLPADTTICTTDSLQLQPVTYGLGYLWSPATGLSSTTVKYPMAAPANNISYTITANLGKCQAQASENIKVVAYPKAYAGADTTICFGGTASLTGIITGSSFIWSPVGNLDNASTLQPAASPSFTTAYILTSMDTLGCPKPFSDTVIVFVLPQINLFAGNDTSVVIGQPLQLNAVSSDSSSLNYSWVPASWLSNTSINNPLAIISSAAVDSITYTVRVTNSIGCYATDNIKVLVYKTLPGIFMPNAFTPNGDGNNDVIRPVLVGIANLDYFKVFNRWGQIIFSTTQNAKGWDGAIGGHTQAPATFVYIVQAKDYTGKTIFKKGTFVLVK